MLKKMIAFQKLLFSMFLPTMRVNNEKKKTGEILCLILCFLAALLSILRINSYAGGFSTGGALFVFLYYEWITKSFLSNLPLNRRFLLSGVIMFSNLVVICSFVVIYGFVYLFVSTSMVILYLLGVSQEIISPDAAILQVLLIAVCTSLFYTNAVTSMLLLKRRIQRIAGMIAVTAVIVPPPGSFFRIRADIYWPRILCKTIYGRYQTAGRLPE